MSKYFASKRVPANSSRYFDNQVDAVNQTSGSISLNWDMDRQFFFNIAYNKNLIKFDSKQNTQVPTDSASSYKNTLRYLLGNKTIESYLKRAKAVIEIGCGQGELVLSLQSYGVSILGYDSVATSNSPFIRQELFTFQEKGDFYIMRCVLPHIESPWHFLDELLQDSNSLVLIEYQDLHFILNNGLWNRISHDHVNIFTDRAFHTKYRVLASGSVNSEWKYVLVTSIKSNGVSYCPGPHIDFPIAMRSLERQRHNFLQFFLRRDNPLVIYGGAGTGAILSAELKNLGKKVLFAADIDPGKQNLFMEYSGVEIRHPVDILDCSKDVVVIVANPSHLRFARKFIGKRYCVTTSIPTKNLKSAEW